MSEPAAADMSAMDATTNAAHEVLPQSLAGYDKTALATPVDGTTFRDRDTLFEPMLGLALFSTEMGTRPQRPVPVPSDAPPIARSDPIQAVVDTAMYWRKKHYRASLAIFPYIGWKIEDLWDAEDIHIYTPKHCSDVLDFMSLDNLSAARKYARKWAQHNQEHLDKTLGRETGDLGDLIDPTSHWSLLDKVFVDGESSGWPRQFLWHVAHIIRSQILEERAKEQLATAQPAVQQPVPTLTVKGRTDSFTTRAPLQPSLAYAQQMPAPFIPNMQPVAPPHATGGRRPPSHGPPQSGLHYGPHIGHAMAGMPPNAMGSPSMSVEVVRNPRTRPYNHDMPGGMHGENFAHMAQGAYFSRSPSVTMQSPRFNNAQMAMSSGAILPPNAMQPSGYRPGPPGPHGPQGYQPSSPSMFPAQPHHPGMGRPGPQHPAYMTSPQMIPSYMQQGPNDRGPRGASFEDMTNMPFNGNHGAPHNADPRRSGRHSSSYGSGSHALYDPYNGTRPGFNDPNAGRKPSRGAFIDQPGRTRKPSATDNRPRTGSHGNTWIDVPSNSNAYRYPRGRTIDDPAIINDPERGCHTKWIGPENHNVNELFVSDLPDNIQEEEIKDMFVREINIKPVRVSFGKQQSAAPRQHAFALFTTASEAKLGLSAGEAGPIIRGVPVRITVPRRFYQKTDDYYNHYEAQKLENKPVKERDALGFAQNSSHEAESITTNVKTQTTKLQYSPQDVRSDLQKTSLLSSDADCVSLPGLDPRTIRRNSFPESKATTVCEGSAQNEYSIGVAQAALILKSADMSKETTHDVRETVKEQQSLVPSLSSEVDMAEPLLVSREIVQPVVNDVNKIVKESPARSSAKKQTTIEAISDEENKVITAAEALGPAEDDAVKAKHIITLADGKHNIAPEADIKVPTVQDLGSDDDADHDASFQSAQEVVDGTEPTLVAGMGPSTTNHGSDVGTAAAIKSSLEEENSPQPAATNEKTLPSPIKATQTTSTPAPTVAEIPVEDKPNMSVERGAEKVNTTSWKPSAPAMKSQGPQQTPSLNPFAKPSKAQRKKDKQQQKKKDSKTLKTKIGETSTTTTSSSSAPSANTQPDVPATSGTSSSSVQSQIPVSPTTSAAQVSEDDSVTKGKAKAKSEATATNNLDNEALVENQLDGATAVTTGESSSVIREAQADQKMATAVVKKSSTTLASNSGAQSAESYGETSDEPAFNSTLTPPPATASTEGIVMSEGASTAPQMKKTAPAVPHLHLSSGLASTREPDAASTASSDTLHPSVSTAQLSPSPTAEDFHTPLQTPAATSAPQEQVVPPKKKKNKKKKKKTAAPVSTDASKTNDSIGETISSQVTFTGPNKNAGGSSVHDHSGDPFGDQLSHIDMVRKAVKDPNTYYNRTYQELPGQNPNTTQVPLGRDIDYRTSPAKAADKNPIETKNDSAPKAETWCQIQDFLSKNAIFDQS